MKYLILSFFAIIAFSCTKTKTETVTVIKNDTTIITNTITDTLYKEPLIGEWRSVDPGYSNLEPTFTRDTFYFGHVPGIYVASSDTIYAKYSNTTIDHWFAYTISANHDTLTLANSWTYFLKFYRIN